MPCRSEWPSIRNALKESPEKRPVVQLFDLVDDPHERNDLAAQPEYANVVRELSDRLWRWMEEVEDPNLDGPFVTPYYREAIADYNRFREERTDKP